MDYALTNGLMNGVGGGKFEPDTTLNRAMVATVLYRLSGDKVSATNAFPDVPANEWYGEAVAWAQQKGIVTGFEDGTFRPNAEITRAEVMEIINNVLFRTPDKDHFLDDMVKWPDNSNPNAWYYEPVQEATNSHDYERVDNTSPETWTKITQQRDWDALEAELAQKYPNR